MTQRNDERGASGSEPALGPAGAEARACLATVEATAAAGGDLTPHLARLADALATLERSAASASYRLRSVLDAVPDAVTVHDSEGRVVDANRTACDVFGYSIEELRQLDVRDLNPELPEAHMSTVRQTFQVGETVTVETTNRRADGSRFPVEVHSNAYEDGDDRRIVAVARDVTLRQQAALALRSSEERYRRLLDAVDKGIIVQDGDGRIISANAAAARFLDVSIEQLRDAGGMNAEFWSVIDDQGRPLELAETPGPRALRSGLVVESTLIGVRLRASQAYRWFTVTSVPQFMDGADRPFQVISVFGDVTDLKRQSEQFEQTQALASIGSWELQFGGMTVLASAEVFRLLELPRDAALQWEQLVDAFIAADGETLARAVATTQRDALPFDLELRLGARGQRRCLRVLGRPIAPGGDVQGITGTLQDVTLRKTQEDQLRRQAQTDPLTGLANRDAMLRALTRAIDDAPPGHGPALLYIDLDRFKVINDLLGHGAGDGLLIAAAKRLQEIAGPDALVARFGGDEFMVVQPWRDDATAAALAERLTAGFARPFVYASEEFTITASVGVAQFPDDGATIQQLINHADAAMFEAKRRGRNKWQHFSPQLARSLSDRLLVETQLRRALDNNEFYLHYQPQVDLGTGAIVGAEALLRWRNRLLGEMSPAVFISHAENTGDIVRIGEWVIRAACAQMRDWQHDGIDVPKIAVNVSYRQFLNEGLTEVVRKALLDSGLPGDRLEIEMTERVLVEDVPDTGETFAGLRALGCNLVIDDFGEGYSALSYLRQFPFNGLKIGHRFMHGVPESAADAAICKAIIGIAQSLGLLVIAEGVELAQQRRFLLEHGARFAQGFMFSRPVSAVELADYALRFPAPVV